MDPEGAQQAGSIPHGFLENHCQDYVLVRGDDHLSAALDRLQDRKGDLNWTLVLQDPAGYMAAPFKEILKWERAQSDRSAVRETSLDQLDLPFAALESCEDNSSLLQLQERAHKHPYGLVLVTWQGTSLVSGVAESQKISRLLNIEPSGAGSTPSVKSAAAPGQAMPGPVGSPAAANPSPSSPTNQEHRKSLGERIDEFESRTRAVYRKYRINFLIGFISFLVAVVSLALAIRSDILPAFIPEKMSGEWNVAVAEFTAQGDQNISQNRARQMSNVFFTKFSSEIENLADQAGIAIQVLEPAAAGIIKGNTPEERAARADAVAKKFNADVVIYGTIKSSGELISFKPEFYVDIHNMYEAEEMVGQHSLGEKIMLLGGNLEQQSQVQLDRELSRRSKLMALVTKGLSLYFGGFYKDAYRLFQEANRDENWENESGREVMHLFTGNAANRSRLADEAQGFYLKAIDIDDQYARAYIGLGHAHFAQALEGACSQDFQIDTAKLDAALDNFIGAEAKSNQPPSADIATKAAFGKGQVYITKYFTGNQSSLSDAKEQFQMVIDEYSSTGNERVKELASESYSRLGLLARQEEDLDTAVELYTKGLELASDHARRGFIQLTLADINQKLGKTAPANDYAQEAIEAYRASLTLTSDPELKANRNKGIGIAHMLRGESEEALRAFQEALELLPEGSCEYNQIQSLLEDLR